MSSSQEENLKESKELIYKKPSYNPWEIFKPPKALINECIKNLKQQCYELLQENQNDPSGFAALCNKSRLDKLNRQIREYTYQLRPISKRSKTEITPDCIRRAKESLIQDYFDFGKLRRQGKDFIGLCPFHNDTKPSFTIYEGGRRFHCFACSETGDTIDYIKKTQNLTFIEAIKFILHL